MKKPKFFTFVASVFSVAIVVFNSVTDTIQKIFEPKVNMLFLYSLLGMIFLSIWYVVKNWNEGE